MAIYHVVECHNGKTECDFVEKHSTVRHQVADGDGLASV
jgi:hypothetical protein